jgi:uncharacterized protein
MAMASKDGGARARALRVRVDAGTSVPALLLRPRDARALCVLAHGAGAGMLHPFMESLARALSARGTATLRYEFPYMARGLRRPDAEAVLLATVRAAVAAGRARADGLPLVAGGKSMGGRMTSRAAALEPLEGVRGLVFVGFPLHPAGRPDTTRAGHLGRVTVPMLFLQGDRDRLADLARLRPVVAHLGRRARLRVFAGADHSFHVPKRSGRTDAEVIEIMAAALADWATGLRP